ncbi:MAG: M13 family metallopeptidase [Clostridiales bacterium]|nr:M13 family metallopeptidase [Clostridiales bacterium]
MDKIRIQDDLFNSVNGEWQESAVIPDDMPSTGAFEEIFNKVELQLREDINEMSKNHSYENSHMEHACKLFEKVKDTKTLNREKMRPAYKGLDRINKLKDVTAFNRNLKELVLDGVPVPFSIDVETDLKDTDKHCVLLLGPDTLLPDSSYYRPGMEQQKAMMIGLCSNMIGALLAETKLSPEDQQLFLKDTLAFDEVIGSLVKSREEFTRYTELYNPFSTRTVSGLMKPVKVRKLLTDLFGTAPEEIIVGDPKFLKNFKTLFNKEAFVQYKHWAYVRYLMKATAFLSEHLRELGNMFMMALTGINKMPVPEKYAFLTTSGYYSEPIGMYYAHKYFGEEAKKDITDIAHKIIDQYRERISNNSILSDETKKKAIKKLSSIVVRMGYPDKVSPIYDKLVFDDKDSLLTVISKLGRIKREDSFSKLYKPTDKTEWPMSAHTINACYNPFDNSVTFPAGILQPPFYSLKQTRSQNLGGIGAVMGHEISHAFDSNGAKCDEKGNLNNWWTKEDFKAFKASTKAMIKEYDGYELPWGKVNGTLTVSENIADNGGMAVTLDLMKKTKNASYEEYFTQWAKVWATKARPEYLQLLLTIDEHSPAMARANMTPRNFEEWYNAFNVTKKDKMYLAPNKRVVIW